MPESNFTRREFLKRSLALGAVATAAGGVKAHEQLTGKGEEPLEPTQTSHVTEDIEKIRERLIQGRKQYLKIQRRIAFYGEYEGYADMESYDQDHPEVTSDNTNYLDLQSRQEIQDIPTISTQYDALIDSAIATEAANNEDIDQSNLQEYRDFMVALMIAESFQDRGTLENSDLDPTAVSGDGAEGLFQLMPDIAESLEVEDSLDPEQNIRGGIKQYTYLLEQFTNPAITYKDANKKARDPWLALAAYNMGETELRKVLRNWQGTHFISEQYTKIAPNDLIQHLQEQGQQETAKHLKKVAILLDYVDLSDLEETDENLMRTYTIARAKYHPLFQAS